MKNLFILLAMIFSLSISAQEICNNGIDDDGDGLIDINDSDCDCSITGTTPSSLIPNPSFEDNSCCPSDFSQLSCADTWQQASDATSDYLNTCDFTYTAPLPFPNGNGGAGLIIMNSTDPTFPNNYLEYLGAALTSPLVSGTQYTLDFNIAFDWVSGYVSANPLPPNPSCPIDITIYGTPNAGDLPWSGNDCPIGVGGFAVIGSISYSPDATGGWQNLTVTFTPSFDVYAIALGGPCNIPVGCGYVIDDINEPLPYFYIDNLILNEAALFNPVTVDQTGHMCTNDLLLTATSSGAGTYQWYFEGVAIVGQTNISLDVSSVGLGDGVYQVMYTETNGCAVAESTVSTPIVTAVASADEAICDGASATISASGGIGYLWDNSLGTGSSQTVTPTVTTTYTVTASDANGCTDTDEVTITVNPNPTPNITGILTICSGMATDLDAGAGYANYSWSPASSNQVISASTIGNYSVTVTDNNGCMGSDMVTVTENQSLTPNITGILAICEGESTILDAGSYASYVWTPAGGSQTITVTTAGTYAVTVTDVNGCSGSDQVTVDVQSVSTTITGALGMCPGESTTLDAGAGADNYLWNTGATTQTLTVSSEGNYSVTVSNTLGCSDEDAVTVDIDYLNLVASSDKLICDGATADLAAALSSGGIPPFTYYWSTNESTSNITVSPTTETTYTVYLIDAFGCVSNTENITVSINPPVSFDIYSNRDTVCPGDPVLITSTVTSGVPPYTITDGANNVVNVTNIEYPYQQQTYIYTVLDACGSTASDMVTINTHPIPSLNIQADVLSGCEPLSVNFFTPQNNDSYSYSWEFSSGSVGDVAMGASVNHIFEHYGLYDISVSAISDKGCKNSIKINDLINVYRKPEAHFLTKPQTVTIIDPQIQFSNLSQWADYYVWSFGDGDSSNVTNPYHKYDDIDSYIIRLVAITNQGCVDSVIQQVIVENEPTIYVPTAFSPDGDGINDFFVVKANGIDLDNYNLKVYDRWGEIIFESNDLFHSWDGKAKDKDKYVENGSFVWLLKVNYENGIEYEKSGTVTIIR